MNDVTKRVNIEPPAPALHASAAAPWRRILFWLIATRLIVAMMAGFSTLVIPAGHHMGAPGSLWAALLRWDTGWFASVVEKGYYFLPGQESNIAFLPLYPALVWILSLGRLLDIYAVGVLISNAALFGACLSIWRITERRWRSTETSDLAVILVLISPVSFFCSIFYSEAVFLCAVAACLDFAEQERWAIAGVSGMIAALARNSGFLLAVPLLIYFLLPWKRQRDWRQILWIALPVAGSALFTLFLWYRFGDPMVFTKAQLAWGRELTWPWVAFQSGYHNNYIPQFFRIYFKGAALMAGVLLLVAAAVRARWAWVSLMILWPLLYLSTTILDSLPRYLTTVAPYYPVAAAAATQRWPLARYPLLLWSAMLLMISIALFVNGYWFV